jgi:hypothetical protein
MFSVSLDCPFFYCPFGCSLKFIYNIILKAVGLNKDTEEKSSFGKLLFANKVLDFINIPNILHHKTINARISQYLKTNMSHLFHINKKSLKIPKGQSEAVNRRRTDNTMANRRRTDNTMAKRRTDNTMAKRRTDSTMAKRRTDNTMAKRRRTDNTMAKRRTDNTMAKRRTDNIID